MWVTINKNFSNNYATKAISYSPDQGRQEESTSETCEK